MKIFLAADHAGYGAKEALKKVLIEKGYEVDDKGAHSFDPGDDYPGVMKAAAEGVLQNPGSRAFLFGGSGQGEAMVANRHRGIRAAVYYGGQKDLITLSREHNDANVLSFGARFMTTNAVIEAAFLWLDTKFSGIERHRRRIAVIDEM